MTSALANLTTEQHKDDVIKHALDIRSAWSLNNYRKFYTLYEKSPKMSSHLIDWFLDRERKSHLKLMMKVYVKSSLYASLIILVVQRLTCIISCSALTKFPLLLTPIFAIENYGVT